MAVGSRSLTKAEAFAEEYGVTRAYGSYEELVADPDVDVIYVASVHNDHLSSARLCLEAGKAVLVEKPLTVSAAQTSELIDLARERGLFLMEAHVESDESPAPQGRRDRGLGRARPGPARGGLVRVRVRRRARRTGCSTRSRPAAPSSIWASTRCTWSTCSSANRTG